MQPEGTQPYGPSLSDHRKLHDAVRSDISNHTSEQGNTQPHDIAVVSDEPAELTGVGHKVTEGGVTRVIDEAHWEPHVPPDTNHWFALVVSIHEEKQQLSVKSPFLVSLFEHVITRNGMMGMTKGSEGISFPEPYVPLYWCYSHIIKSGLEADHPSQQDIRDLRSLRYWYERWALPAHNRIRQTIESGFIAFEDSWALFPPGEMVYTEDDFEQPELSIVTESNYEFAGAPPPPPHPYRAAQGQLPDPSKTPPLSVSSWYQGWDPWRQMFVKWLRLSTIMPFDGSRRITDLKGYPVRFFDEGDQSKIETLQQKLEHRGHRWKGLFGPSVQHLYHEGPAKTEMSGVFKSMDIGYDGHGKIHVSQHSIREIKGSRLTTMLISFRREL